MSRPTSPLQPITISAADCTCQLKRSIIAELPFLQQLSAEDIDAVQALFIDRAFAAGQSIQVRTSTGNENQHSLYVVGAGLVKLLRSDSDAHDTVLDILVTGESFGLDFDHDDLAVSHTNSCVFEIKPADLEQLFRRYPSIPSSLLRLSSSRITTLHRRLQLLSGAPARIRIIASLLQLSDKTGTARSRFVPGRSEEILLQLPLTRDDLAAFSGTTTETASRVVSALEREKLIKTGRRWFSLLQPSLLKSEISAVI